MACLARDCPSWHDDVWLVDSTPIERGRSRETQQRSDLAGWATYGYSASHSRWFWGLCLHLLATPAGLPIAFALTGAKADERDTCLDMIADAGVTRRAQTLIADKGYRSAAFEQQLADAGITLIRPATTTEPARGAQTFLRPCRVPRATPRIAYAHSHESQRNSPPDDATRSAIRCRTFYCYQQASTGAAQWASGRSDGGLLDVLVSRCGATGHVHAPRAGTSRALDVGFDSVESSLH